MQQVVFSHVDVAGIGGQQAVAAVGTPPRDRAARRGSNARMRAEQSQA